MSEMLDFRLRLHVRKTSRAKVAVWLVERVVSVATWIAGWHCKTTRRRT